MSLPAHLYTLYRLYDAAGALLYVGVSRAHRWRPKSPAETP
jgi:hypothetical protein